MRLGLHPEDGGIAPVTGGASHRPHSPARQVSVSGTFSACPAVSVQGTSLEAPLALGSAIPGRFADGGDFKGVPCSETTP